MNNSCAKPKELSIAVRVAIASLILGSASASRAQSADDDQSAHGAGSNVSAAIEEVVVTGTRIRGAEAPVGADLISFDRDYIENSPSVSVDKLLHEVPQVMNMGVSEASRDQAGGNGNIVHGNAVNLRGIGPFATLVLVDGHRPVTNSVNFEPSALPMLALERVEIVPGGASAVYGSDAIAGVVNLVMRRNVDGGQVLLQGGVGDDYNTRRLGASWGTTFDKGQFFGAVERSFRSNLNTGDRDYITALQDSADYRSGQCAPGNIIADGQSYAIPEGGVTPATAGDLTAGTRNLCEPFAGEDLLPEQQYTNAAFTFNYEFTDKVEFYADVFWSEREFERQPSYATGTLSVPSSNLWFVDPTGTGLSSVQVEYSFANDLPRDPETGRVRAWQTTAGLKVDLPADWRLDTLVSYGENREYAESSTRGLDSTGSLGAALASSDPATAFDPFGLHRTSDDVLQAISDQIFIVDDEVEFTGTEIRLDGPIAELPGGVVQLATGYEYQDLSSVPQLRRGGPDAVFNCVPCSVAGVDSLDRSVDSVYAEVLVPIFGPGNAVAGIQNLDLRAAWRKDKYSDVGETSNPQLGVSWVPTEGLTLRASYGESFRAPLFSDLFGNSSFLPVEEFTDPTAPDLVTTGVFQTGGNPDLEPETATTQSFGFDWEPAAWPGARLSMTYFDVEYEGQIANYLGDNNILNREELFEGTGIILRDAEAAERVQSLVDQGMLVRGVLPDPVTLYVDGRPQNLGVSRTKGIDFAGQYQWAGNTGSYAFRLGGMVVTDYEVAVTPSSEMLDRRNVIFNPHKLRLRASLDWFRDSLGARVVVNHVGSYENDNVGPSQTVSSYNPVDLSVWTELGDPSGNDLSDAWKLSLSATNVFDEEPPYVNVRMGYDPTVHSPVGRLLNVTVEKRF